MHALALSLFLGCAAPRAAAPPPAAAPVGLDARLTAFGYPHPVTFHETTAQGLDLEMAYMDVAPDGPARGTVLLLHGKNFSGAYWAETIAALTAEGYRVVVPDQVGFGKSSKPTELQYSFHQLAVLTGEVLDRLEVGPVAVVGHSMGGMLAARFALLFPERTRSLTLINPIGLEDWKRVVPYRTVDAWTAGELRKTPEGVQRYMRDAYFAGEWEPAFEPLLAIQAGWAVGPDRALLARVSALTYDMIFTQPVIYELEDIEAPTLLLIGQRDRTALGRDAVAPEVAATLGDYPALGAAAAARIPDARLVALEDVGHVPHYEDFDRTMAALLGFLGQ